MLLVNTESFNVENGIGEAKQVLLDFANKIEGSIDVSDWETLTAILESRQKFLEQLFQRSIPLNARNAFKQLAQAVIEMDEVFQVRIQLQKKNVEQEQFSLERSRRAISAYNDQ